MVTSNAIAISGFNLNADVLAPFNPTSSCTVPTPYTVASQSVCFITSAITAQPTRLSNALPITRSFKHSSNSVWNTTASPIETRLSACSLSLAPISINIFLYGIIFLASAALVIWGGLEPIIPGTSPFSVCTYTFWFNNIWSLIPPILTNLKYPSSSMKLTIRPISSICEANITLGFPSLPLWVVIRLPIISVSISSTWSFNSSFKISRTSSSKPEIPQASDNFFNKLFIV